MKEILFTKIDITVTIPMFLFQFKFKVHLQRENSYAYQNPDGPSQSRPAKTVVKIIGMPNVARSNT